MKKIILNFNMTSNKQEVQNYIAEQFGFPEYYGKNLDALYDQLTDIIEPVAVGFFMPTPSLDEMDIELMLYLDKVRRVFSEAEDDNPYLGVIMGELEANFEDGSEMENLAEEDFMNWYY